MQLCNSISSLSLIVQANHAPTVALAGDDGGELQLLCLGDEQGHIVLIEAAEEECGSRRHA